MGAGPFNPAAHFEDHIGHRTSRSRNLRGVLFFSTLLKGDELMGACATCTWLENGRCHNPGCYVVPNLPEDKLTIIEFPEDSECNLYDRDELLDL